MWWFVVACDPPPLACGTAECAEVCAAETKPAPIAPVPLPVDAPAAPSAATAFEDQLLGPMRDDLRAGVRPWTDQGIGVCVGKKDCAEFLGTDPTDPLPPGDYLVKAELRVPAAGEKGTWKVKFASECTIDHAGAPPTVATYERTYDVWYAGPDKGYRLLPLRMIESPSKEGPQTCRYTLTAPNPAEGADEVYRGSWKLPAR